MNIVFSSNPDCINLGLTIIRVGIGIIFIKHGYPKLLKGKTEWQWLGEQMSYFGISFSPIVWGFLACFAEFFGGLFLAVGLGTRIAAFFIACSMAVATNMHIQKGDSWGWISHPLSLLVVMIGFMVAGGGPYALEIRLGLATFVQ